MSQCKLWLDNYSGHYYPGSVIQGKVILNLTSETTARAVKVRVVCHEHTEFMATESHYDQERNEHRNRDTNFQGDNDVMSTEIILYGGNSGTTSIPMGQHIYPFTFPLPPNLPSTYQCDKGSIAYKITAIVDRPMAMDYEDQFIFVVNSPVDLNFLQKPQLLQPTSYSEEKTVCLWCCSQGPITMDVELPKSTLVPGEIVEVKVTISNMSNTNIEAVTFLLKQRIICKVTEPNKEEKEDNNVLVDLKQVGLGAHAENTYIFQVSLPQNMFIPNVSECKLFSSEYIYEVVAKLPYMHKNLKITIHPEIGHIEIGRRGQSPTGGAVISSNPVLPPAGTAGWSLPGPLPSAPQALNGFNSKENEAATGYNQNSPYPEPPPSYDSLRT